MPWLLRSLIQTTLRTFFTQTAVREIVMLILSVLWIGEEDWELGIDVLLFLNNDT